MSLLSKKKKNKSWQRKNPKVYSGISRKENRGEGSRFSRFLFWVLFLAFLGVSGYILFFSPFLEIESVSVEGNQDIPSEEIAGKANEALNGKYFNLLSKKNYFLASRKGIGDKLKNDFNRLEVSLIEKKFPRAVLVKVTERQPEMAWCSAGVCYLADKNGFIYSGANATDEELNRNRFLIVVDDSARPVEIRKTIVGRDFIQYLKQMDAIIIDDLQFKIEGNYHTPALSSQEVILRIKEGDEAIWTLKMSRDVPPEEAKKIIQTVFGKDLDEEKRKNLDYLDLRLKGKVYYKLKT